jgi:HEAT repeat protein
LRDLLRVDGSLPGLLVAQLKTGEFNDRTRADLYLALELAGTVEAQTALSSVVSDDSWSVRDGMRAIVALGGMQNPSSETLDVLWDTVEYNERKELASTATFALGALGNGMNAEQNTEYAYLRERLVSGATSNVDSEQRVNFVHALGNTQDETLGDDVALMLEDKDPIIRRAAAQSLALLNTDQHAEELMSHFAKETNNQVRGAMVETLVNWSDPPASAVKTIRNAVSTEVHENTRFQMARFLGANLEKFPENKPILQNLLRVEQSKRVRENIAETLARVN